MRRRSLQLRLAVPWTRADCAGAAAFVLQRRSPHEPVVGNHWEHEYYFRHVQPAYRYVARADELRCGRFWLLATGDTAGLREPIIQHFCSQGWQLFSRHEFEKTTVAQLGWNPPQPGDPSKSPSSSDQSRP